MKRKIEVTQDHIKKGCPGDSQHCAVALAINEHSLVSADVGTNDIRLIGSTHHQRTPKKVADFIDKFDKDKAFVEPISFWFDIPKELLK
jgi:hypothetical protein